MRYLVLVGLLACSVPVEGVAPDGSEPTAEPWRECLTSQGPCVDPVFCDERSAADDGRCEGVADNSCRTAPAPDGVACFPTVDVATGRCAGGVCRAAR